MIALRLYMNDDSKQDKEAYERWMIRERRQIENGAYMSDAEILEHIYEDITGNPYTRTENESEALFDFLTKGVLLHTAFLRKVERAWEYERE